MNIDQSLDVKTDTLLDRAVLYTAVFLFTMTIVLVSIQVVLRYVPIQFPWGYLTEPLSRYTLIIGTYFGAAAAARNNEHISMYFVLERLGRSHPLVHAILQLFVSIIVLAFLLIATGASVFAATNNWGANFGGTYIVTVGEMMLLISIGLALYFLYSLVNLRDSVRSLNEQLRGDNRTE